MEFGFAIAELFRWVQRMLGRVAARIILIIALVFGGIVALPLAIKSIEEMQQLLGLNRVSAEYIAIVTGSVLLYLLLLGTVILLWLVLTKIAIGTLDWLFLDRRLLLRMEKDIAEIKEAVVQLQRSRRRRGIA